MVHKPLYEQIHVQIWPKFWLIIFQLHFSEQCTLFFVFERKLHIIATFLPEKLFADLLLSLPGFLAERESTKLFSKDRCRTRNTGQLIDYLPKSFQVQTFCARRFLGAGGCFWGAC